MARSRALLRILAGTLFVLVFFSVIAGVHVYLARRLVYDPGLPPALETAAIGALLLLFGTVVALPFAERLLPPRSLRWLAWPASVWMGLFFLLFTGLAVSDSLLLLATGVAQAGVGPVPPDPSAGRALGVAALALGAGAFALVSCLRGPEVKRIDVALPDWPEALDGFRIVQISDIHIGPLLDRRFARWLVERCNGLEPDVVAITGDLVDGPVHHLAEEVAPFKELSARHGVYFVTGNHDHYSDARSWVPEVASLGIRVLRNERVTIEERGAAFELAGVDDHQGTFEPGWREDLDRALEGCPPEAPVVLLAHDPRTFKKASARGVALQLSGHTHGGQIWPFRYFVYLATRWVSGLYREGRSQLYVSRGTGFWGPPMRLFAPAEITELVLSRAS